MLVYDLYTYKVVDNKITEQRCGSCNNDEFVYIQREGDMCCNKCGTVVESRMMVDDSVNLYAPEDGGVNPNMRHGCPVVDYLPHASLSTRIGYGGKIDASTRRALQHTSMPSRERTLFKKFKELDRILSALHIDSPVVTNWANRIWADLRARNVTAKGENNTALMAACVFYACKLSQFSRTPEEVLQAAGLCADAKFGKFNAESKRIVDVFGQPVSDRPEYFGDMIEEVETDMDVPRYVNMLYVKPPWPLVRETRKVLLLIQEHEQMVNAHEQTLVAVAVFIAASRMDGVLMPLMVRLNNKPIPVPGQTPQQRTPITLDMLYAVYGVQTATLQKNIQAVADKVPQLNTARLVEALALRTKPVTITREMLSGPQKKPSKIHKVAGLAPDRVAGGVSKKASV